MTDEKAAAHVEGKTTVEPFVPGMLPAVRSFSERYWKRPTEDAYFDWRYLQPLAFSRMFVALRDGECVGTLFSLRKTYRMRGELVRCLEVFDWHAISELRGAGVGIRLMRAMMKQPERVFSIGGTGDVHATLPLMGWQQVTTAQAYELVSRGDLIVERLESTRRLPAAIARPLRRPASMVVLPPWRKRGPAGGEVREVDLPGDEVRALYEGDTGHDLVQEPDIDVIRWIKSGRWSGSWRCFEFRVDGKLRGWSMTRLNVGSRGLQGTIVEVFAPNANAELYQWMVSEAADSLLSARPRRITSRASCPHLQRAFTACGFRHAGVDAPIRSWPKAGLGAFETPHFTYLHSDGPILPYDTEHQATSK
jgi:hypothetical protein